MLLAQHVASDTKPVLAPKTLTQDWYVVLFDGRKAGSLLIERHTEADRFINSEITDLELMRGDSKISLYTEQRFEESLDHVPLAVSFRMRTSGLETALDARISSDRSMSINETIAGQKQSRTAKLDKAVLFPEAQVAKLLANGFKPNAKVEFFAYDPSSAETMRVETTFLDSQMVDLIDRSERLTEVEQTLHYGANSISVKSFVDAQFKPHKTALSIMGLELEIVAATKAMAMAENQSGDEFVQMMMQSPRNLSRAELSSGLRYQLNYNGDALMPDTGEQHVQKNSDGFLVDVCARCGKEAKLDSAELARHTQPSRFLQSAHPDILAAAKRVRDLLDKDAQVNPAAVMQALQTFVTQHINKKNLDVGYASALEVLRDRQGDCTEHAVLLAALGRSLGIPTRVAGGYAYAGEYLGQSNTFVPHAWTQAYVDGRWRSFDAALEGFTAGHLVIETGDGDPAKFFGGIHLHGNIDIQSVSALPKAQSKAR